MVGELDGELDGELVLLQSALRKGGWDVVVVVGLLQSPCAPPSLRSAPLRVSCAVPLSLLRSSRFAPCAPESPRAPPSPLRCAALRLLHYGVSPGEM